MRLSIMGAVLALAVAPAAAGELSGEQIRALLTGNSIVHPDFGCVHYPDDHSSVAYVGGEEYPGTWSVEGDLYHSDGQCGRIGCRLTGASPEYTFRRVDGDYTQPVIVIQGNYCRKDGIIS